MPRLPKAKSLSWRTKTKTKAYEGSKKKYETINKKFYDSKEWKDLRQYFITRHPLCKWCEEEGTTNKGDVVDHIKEITDGGESLDFNNLQTLCHKHHNQKTNWERAKRRKKKK